MNPGVPNPIEINPAEIIPLIDAPNVSTDINICAICHDDFTYENPRYRLYACDHVFHRDCVTSWFRRGGTCPSCRNPSIINPPRIYRFSFYSPEPLTIDTKEKYMLQLVNKLDKLISMLESPKTSKNVKSFIELTIIMIYIKTLLVFKEKYNMSHEETQALMKL